MGLDHVVEVVVVIDHTGLWMRLTQHNWMTMFPQPHKVMMSIQLNSLMEMPLSRQLVGWNHEDRIDYKHQRLKANLEIYFIR